MSGEIHRILRSVSQTMHITRSCKVKIYFRKRTNRNHFINNPQIHKTYRGGYPFTIKFKGKAF